MICFVCHKPIAGYDYRRRVEWRTYRSEEGWDVEQVFGDGIPYSHGSLAEATGTLVRVAHHKHYFVYRKRAELLLAKADDPSSESRISDWREQEVAEVEDLAGEGHGDHRGPGEVHLRVR